MTRNESSCWPNHYWLARGHQGGPLFPLSILATQRDPHHWGWSSPVRWSTCHSSCQKGETPASTASIPSRNNKVTVACMWKFLLARHQQGHWRSSLPVWNLHLIPESEHCSTPHTYTHTISPMADVCHRHLHTRRSWPPGSGWQSNANEVVSLLKGMFSEHGIPEILCPDNGPQYVSAQFANFCISWGITHKTSSLHYPQSNGFTEACIKSIKYALQRAKYSSANPHLTLLVLQTTPIDTKLPSPAELLYQCQLRTTIPAKICNSNPSAIQIYEQIDTCSKAAKAQADKHSKTLVPLYAGQPVAMYDTLRRIWVPATVICVLPQNRYQVCTSNGSTYCCTQRYLGECSVKVVDTVPSGTTATPQVPTWQCFSAVQPAPAPPAQHMQPTPAAPVTLATQMSQAPAVPVMPTVQKNALAPMSVTSHATPVQPQRSGHACIAPRYLIQEIWELQPGPSTDLVS